MNRHKLKVSSPNPAISGDQRGGLFRLQKCSNTFAALRLLPSCNAPDPWVDIFHPANTRSPKPRIMIIVRCGIDSTLLTKAHLVEIEGCFGPIVSFPFLG